MEALELSLLAARSRGAEHEVALTELVIAESRPLSGPAPSPRRGPSASEEAGLAGE